MLHIVVILMNHLAMRTTMLWAARITAAVCALAISQPAAACNREGFELPWDLASADKVVVARISNFRIVPNDARGQLIKQAVEAGTAEGWQKKQYEESLSKGLPPGGTFGLFDVSVKEVLKGKSARRFTAIFSDMQYCCFGGKDSSMLPTSMPDQEAIIGLRKSQSDYYNGFRFPLLYTDACVGPMLFGLKNDAHKWHLKEARKYFGSKRKN